MTYHRKEQIGDCTLYLGDCMDILPTLQMVDAVITDPPYGIGEKMTGGTWGSASKYSDFRRWDIAPKFEVLESITQIAPISIIWGGNYFGLPASRCWLSWSKSNAVKTMADFELAWTNLDKPCKQFNWRVGSHKYDHPTEKPIELMLWCLNFVPDSATILDPFMGSATTGTACVQLGRKFIGIEIESRYFDIACERISKAVAQGRLFEPELLRPEQVDLAL